MDNRRFNGNKGHSTRAVRPDDKRLNPAKKLLSKYITEDLDYTQLSKLLNSLYQKGLKGNTHAASLFLSYILGKPKESVDITTDDKPLNTFDLSKLSDTQLEALLVLHGRNSTNTE